MKQHRQLPSRVADRERYTRLQSIFDWVNREFDHSDQAFRDLVSLLGRFEYMHTRPLADLEELEKRKDLMNWQEFHRQFRHDVRLRILGLRTYEIEHDPEAQPRLPDAVIEQINQFRLYGEFVILRGIRQLGVNRGPDGKWCFQSQLRLFDPFLLAKNQYLWPQRVADRKIEEVIYEYMMDMFLGDLVGLPTTAIGVCEECRRLYLNRRRIARQFCSPSCRWRHAVRLGKETKRKSTRKRLSTPTTEPKTEEERAMALLQQLSRASGEKRWEM